MGVSALLKTIIGVPSGDDNSAKAVASKAAGVSTAAMQKCIDDKKMNNTNTNDRVHNHTARTAHRTHHEHQNTHNHNIHSYKSNNNNNENMNLANTSIHSSQPSLGKRKFVQVDIAHRHQEGNLKSRRISSPSAPPAHTPAPSPSLSQYPSQYASPYESHHYSLSSSQPYVASLAGPTAEASATTSAAALSYLSALSAGVAMACPPPSFDTFETFQSYQASETARTRETHTRERDRDTDKERGRKRGRGTSSGKSPQTVIQKMVHVILLNTRGFESLSHADQKSIKKKAADKVFKDWASKPRAIGAREWLGSKRKKGIAQLAVKYVEKYSHR